jgi:hypothetical protein
MLRKNQNTYPVDVIWSSYSESGDKGCMPIGNGDVAANVWVEPDKGLFLYLIKADVFGEDNKSYDAPTPKLGRLCLTFDGMNFPPDKAFCQRLITNDGVMEISAGTAGDQIRIRLWADANMPEIHITMESDAGRRASCSLDTWHTEKRLADGNRSLISFHRYAGQIQAWNSFLPDDMEGRIYGCRISGPEGWSVSDGMLSGSIGSGSRTIDVTMLNSVSPSPELWIEEIRTLHDTCAAVPIEKAFSAHCGWWHGFWARSWICTSGFKDARDVNTFHCLQRYVNACTGRSRVPIHFNGSVFNVSEKGNPDYKKWGQAYWMCNTRPIYWPMLETGDFDLMQPFFNMYGRPEVQEANRKQALKEFKIKGGYIHEVSNRTGCAHFDAWPFPDYQWHYFSSGLEYLAIAIDYWSISGDTECLETNIIPTACDLVLFYRNYGKMGADGKLHWEDINALETFWRASDPACDVGGLMWVIQNLLKLDGLLLPESARRLFEEMQELLPPLPSVTEDGNTRILPCLVDENYKNMENPELYCVFPYRLFTVGKPGLDIGRNTWKHRKYGRPHAKSYWGWWQNGIQSAYLGWPEKASVDLLNRIHHPRSFRFPAFHDYGDWPPSQDYAGCVMKVLHAMLIQADDGRIFLFPAWPDDWDVSFRLYLPEQTQIAVRYENRRITYISVNPERRYKDVMVMNNAALPTNSPWAFE